MTSMVFMLLVIVTFANFYIFHSQSLDQKTIVVITGSSSGIGKSAALSFSNNTLFKVYATMRNPSDWTDASNPNLEVIQMDVTVEDSVNKAVKVILEKEGRIDVLINNAGYGTAGYLETVTVDEAKALFDVNVWGVVRVLQAVLPGMRRRKKGYVINISSTSGIRGTKYSTNF